MIVTRGVDDAWHLFRGFLQTSFCQSTEGECRNDLAKFQTSDVIRLVSVPFVGLQQFFLDCAVCLMDLNLFEALFEAQLHSRLRLLVHVTNDY